MPSRDNEREKKKVGVKLFLLSYSVKTFLLVLEGTVLLVGAQAHADLSNMAATASGCTICEGCFHSTATTLFLAGSVSHSSSTEAGFLPRKLLFPPLCTSLCSTGFNKIKKKKSQVIKHRRRTDRQRRNHSIIYTSSVRKRQDCDSFDLCSPSLTETQALVQASTLA